MKSIFTLLFTLCTILCSAQTDSVSIDDILEKISRLEELKIANDSINTLEIISSGNAFVKVIDDSTKSSTDSVELGAKIIFDTLTFNVGSITQGVVIEKTFTFTNTGSEDLEIINVLPDCSCTSPRWTDGVIGPGESGMIITKYDSHDDIGKIFKTITVLHNAGEGFSFLEILGFVSPKL